MNRENAEVLALQALGWLASDDEIFSGFLHFSGASPDQLAAAAAQPEFLGSVLDFLLLEDQWIMGFCRVQGLPFDAPMRARAALPGGEMTSWT